MEITTILGAYVILGFLYYIYIETAYSKKKIKNREYFIGALLVSILFWPWFLGLNIFKSPKRTT